MTTDIQESINGLNYGESIKFLVGHVVTGVICDYGLNDGHNDIVFQTTDLIIRYRSVGDCCSESWVENIDDLENMIDSEILSVEALDVTEEKDDRQGSLTKYDYLIKTAKGDARLEFRNTSNGYYGGWLELKSVNSRANGEVLWSDKHESYL